MTNATTTGCDRCHNMQNILRAGSATSYRSSLREESAYQFHMILPSGLNLRTVRELDAELAKSKVELAQP